MQCINLLLLLAVAGAVNAALVNKSFFGWNLVTRSLLI
jgi:hypothetical protein